MNASRLKLVQKLRKATELMICEAFVALFRRCKMRAEPNNAKVRVAMKLGNDSLRFFRSNSFTMHSGVDVKVCIDGLASLECVFAESVEDGFR